MHGVYEMSEYDHENDENIPIKDPTVPQVDFAYANYPVPRKCGNCNMLYEKDGKYYCTMVKGEIDADIGVCNYWSLRKTQPDSKAEWDPLLDKKEAGYVETAPSKCGTCKFYKDPRKCEMVEGDIDPEFGCCTAWTPTKEKKESAESERDHKNILKFYRS